MTKTKPKITRCKMCLMADTKPGLKLSSKGVCQACLNRLKRKDINWENRKVELQDLHHVNHHIGGKYNCIVPSSGGKDSWWQIHKLKQYGFNPLAVRVSDPYTHTPEGNYNWANMLEVFNVDGYTFELSPTMVRKMTIRAFEELGSPTWPIDRAIYTVPLNIAYALGIPLIFYGENVSYEYGGVLSENTASAKNQLSNDVAKDVDIYEFFKGLDIPTKDFEPFRVYAHVLDFVTPYYLSYFFPWSGFKNYCIAITYGFQPLNYIRSGFVDNYDQIDSIGYLANVIMKYPKFGFGRATDVVGYWLRDGLITREQGRYLISKHDYRADDGILFDFLSFIQKNVSYFHEISDKFTVKYDDNLTFMNLQHDPVFEFPSVIKNEFERLTFEKTLKILERS